MSSLETMSDFFTARVSGYDEHMFTNVEGCKEGYIKMASLVPKSTEKLLDLGSGTGLELDRIFEILPDIEVTAIDLTQAMLDELAKKHPSKRMNLICGDYFTVDFGLNCYDCAVSFQTMHHFSHEQKSGLYRKVFDSLKHGGVYIECDYMVEKQEEEDFWFSESARLRAEQGVPDGVFCHYDTPCTMANQIKMMQSAGFENVEKVFRIENTTMLIARKL